MDNDLTLVDVLTGYFSLEEQELMAVRLGMNPKKYLGRYDTSETFALTLLHYFESRGQLSELETAVHEERPHLSWRPHAESRAQVAPAPRLLAPELPKYVLPREVEVTALRSLLLAEGGSAVGIVGPPPVRRADERMVGLRGMGGIGKTVLATVLAHDETLHAHFTDGIFWLTLGERANDADLLSHQTTLARALGDTSAAFTDLRTGKLRLRELFAERRCLLVLDDVWHSDHAIPLAALDRQGRLLLTTRDAQVLSQLDALPYDLELLNETQALGLLAWWAKQELDSLPPQAPDIVRECGSLPLALAMVGALIGNEVDTWESALQKLRARDLKSVEREAGLDYAYPSLWRAIEVSVEVLPAELSERYADFALFPADIPIPPTVLHTLWEHEGIPYHRVTNALNILVNRSLLRKGEESRLTLHDLQLDFVQKQCRDLPALHQRLLNAYAARCADGWASGPDDGYFFQQLPYHLIEAGRGEELTTLLLDYRWLRARLDATDIFTLLGDFERLPLPRYHPTDFPNPGSLDHALSALQDSLRKSAHVLARDKSQLPAHLLARLLAEPLPSLHPIFDQASREVQPTPWLRPLTASLEPPGGPLLRTLKGHTGMVQGVALSGDGRLVVSASDDSTLKVWEVATGRELHTLAGHRKGVRGVALSGDGRLVISASADRTLKVWDVDTGRERRTLTGHAQGVNTVALSGDGAIAVSGATDRSLRVWGLTTGWTRPSLEGHKDGVLGVALSADGQVVVSAAADGTLRVWEMDTGQARHTLSGHVGRVCGVALSGDGGVAVSAASDRTLKVWNLDTGRERRTLTGHRGGVRGVALSGDGKLVVSASSDSTLKVWSLETGRERHTLNGHSDGVNAVALSRDGRLVVSASNDGTLKVWNLDTGRARPSPTGHAGWVRGVALSGNGQRAVSVAHDSILKVWDVATGRVRHSLQGHVGRVWGVALSKDGRLAISAASDRTLKVWDIDTGQEQHTLMGHKGGVWGVALSKDGRLAISASEDCTLKVWDVATGYERLTLTGHKGGVRGVALSGDGRLAVSASEDCTLKVWDLETGSERAILTGHGDWVNGVTLSEDGRFVISASADSTLKVWDLETGNELRRLTGHQGWVRGVALSEDGRLVISAAADRTLKLWDLSRGLILASFETDEPLYCCAITPPFIIAGGQSGRVHFLRLMMSDRG